MKFGFSIEQRVRDSSLSKEWLKPIRIVIMNTAKSNFFIIYLINGGLNKSETGSYDILSG